MTTQSRMSLFVGCFVSMCLLFGLVATVQAVSFPKVADLSIGDLVTSSQTTAIYYFGEDEQRYVFPSEQVFYSWYENFDTVRVISHDNLTMIPLAGNVTYRPHYKGIPSRLVKEYYDPNVHVVFPDAYLLAIEDEETARHFFGAFWASLVDDVPDYLMGDYTKLGGVLNADMEFAPLDHAITISTDKGLHSAVGVLMYEEPLRFATRSETVAAGPYNEATVNRYGTVKFVNYTHETLTIREDRGHWTTGPMEPGDIIVLSIDDVAGEYHFTADEDASMIGTLTVQ